MLMVSLDRKIWDRRFEMPRTARIRHRSTAFTPDGSPPDRCHK
jgi:hypothetical protein